MKKLISILVVVFVAIQCTLVIADTGEEVENWYRSYAVHWFNADVDIETVAQYYASPFYYLGATGPALDTENTMKDSLKSYVKTWKKEGWTGARLLNVEARMLNEKSAMILTEWDIHAADGSSIIGCSRAPWTYLAAKTQEGWKLALEIEIGCGQGLTLTNN
ncbi:MAG: hypothetical protein K9K86_09805 [Pseudomonadales bacterium]|nr:hypothetical protein [Pseudomonadales bacterium]